MAAIQPQVIIDAWVTASWEDYLQVLEDPDFAAARGYYCNGRMKVETSPVGSDHSRDHSIIIHAVHLFAGFKQIDLNGQDNCTYRKAGLREAQPDASFYIGETADTVPYGTRVIDLNLFPPPTLVIEVASTSIADD